MIRFAFLTMTFASGVLAQTPEAKPPLVLAIHGGAGAMVRARMTPEREKAYRHGLERALVAGYGVLEKGGSSLDAVETAVRALEDDPLFNAGKGAVLTAEGKAELDAAIMDGRTLAAGSVAGLTRIKNPVALARRVMAQSPHVMMVGTGAEAFAKSQGLPFVANAYFVAPDRLEAWKKLRKEKAPASTKGTVGAVALDAKGNLAAATSTGGMMNKRFGRVGDAPLIGIGTYADNGTCAISCTGWGEFFIRVVVAHDIAAQMRYQGAPLAAAAQRTLDKVRALGGDGGLIALDPKGNLAMPFNTQGMYRAFRHSDGRAEIAIFAEE